MAPITIEDVVDVEELLRSMRDSMQSTLQARLVSEWRQQNPDATPPPNAYDVLTLKLDHRLLASIIDELARNTAHNMLAIQMPDGRAPHLRKALEE